MTKPEAEFSLKPETTASLDEILDAHRLFIRRARDRAKQVLFFFGLCRPTPNKSVNTVIMHYREFSIGKISELINEVTGFELLIEKMDNFLNELTQLLDPDSKVSSSEWLPEPKKFDEWLEQARKKRDEQGLKWKVNWSLTERELLRVRYCREELERWNSIRNITGQLTPKVESESDGAWRRSRMLVEAFVDFEGATSPLHALACTRDRRPAWLWSLVQWFRKVPMWTTKHLALLLMLVLGTYVVFQVEVVSSLIQNMGAWAAIPFGLALLPLILTDGLIWLRYRGKEEIPAWDVGGVPHRSLLARAPRRFVQRWPTTSTKWSSSQPETVSGKGGGKESINVSQVLDKDPRNIFKLIVQGRVYRLGYLLLWVLSALLLWGLLLSGWLDSTYLTVFLIVVILYSLALAARLIDFWDYFESKSIRLHWLFYSAIGLYALLEGWGYPFFIVVFTIWALWFTWSSIRRPDRPLRRTLAKAFWILVPSVVLLWVTSEQALWRAPEESAQNWRSDITWPFPGNGPVLVMAASGGGSRAALYTALTLEKLEAIQVTCKGESTKCPLSDELQAVSSVSGGSLANAGYVARRLAKINGVQFDKALKESVSEDFILPTLWGAINPILSRGDSIERTWQGLGDLVRSCPQVDTLNNDERRLRLTHGDAVGMKLGDICLSDLAFAWKQALQKNANAKVPFPMPLFNSSTLDGHDLVITPLPKNLYTSSDFAAEARDPNRNLYQSPGATWIFYRDGIYGLEDLLGDSFDPLLSTSVRASANFPFGFPLVRLETHRPLFLRPDWKSRCKEPDWRDCDREMVYITDGGALSNSGMWSMFRLLLNKQTDLRARGVLLILVDASKMAKPGTPEKTYRSLRGTIADQAPIGQYLHRTMLDMLQAVYGDGIAITQIDLEPDRQSNIHTTWAFDRGTRKQLEDIFEKRWEKKQHSLIAKWNYLLERSRNDEKQKPKHELELIDRARPPLD